jgi:hypothetical protein
VFADGLGVETAVNPEQYPGRDLYSNVQKPIGMSHLTLARHGRRGTIHSSLPVAPGQPPGPLANNIVFFDGHPEPIKLEGLWNQYWHTIWEPPAVRPP